MLNRSLKILLAINLIFVFGASLLGPLYAVFIGKIGGNILTIGWAFSVYMITVGLVAFFSGKLGDIIKEKEYLLAIGFLIRGIGFFLYIFIGTIFHLLLLQFLLGIGEAIANPAFKAIYSLHLGRGRESSQWGIWDMSYSMIVGLAAIVGALIVNFFGFTILFYIMSSLSVLAFILLMIQPRKLL